MGFRIGPAGTPLLLTHATALVEPLTVAWHAVNRAPIETAQTALVVGGGPIGLAVVQVLKARGVERIVVAEVSSQQRQRFATTLGATDVVDPRTEDVVAKVRASNISFWPF